MKSNLRRGFGSIFLAAIVISQTSIPAKGETPCGGIQALSCTANNGGIRTGVTREVLERAREGLDLRTGRPDLRVFEYTSVTACQQNLPGGAGTDVPCLGAVAACAGNTSLLGLGPQVRLYRRQLDPASKPVTGWDLIGTTCYPELVPGKPVLGMALILAAFHNTAWAKPAVHIQPEGNITLVTLATYFAVTWPTQGFQPGETDTITLLGNPVRIRPTLKSYTYHFGDHTSTGPTTSPGGPYPNGNITHTYPKAGTYNTRIDITYGGEYSIDASTWVPIPDTVTIPGPTQTLTVKTAHARLVSK